MYLALYHHAGQGLGHVYVVGQVDRIEHNNRTGPRVNHKKRRMGYTQTAYRFRVWLVADRKAGTSCNIGQKATIRFQLTVIKYEPQNGALLRSHHARASRATRRLKKV